MADRDTDEPLVHRLDDIVVERVSLVDRGANQRKFLVVKRDEETPDDANKKEPKMTTDSTAKGAGGALRAAGEKLAALAQKAGEEDLQPELMKELAAIVSELRAATKMPMPEDEEEMRAKAAAIAKAAKDADATIRKSLGAQDSESTDAAIARLKGAADASADLAKRVATLEADKGEREHAAIFKSLVDARKLPASLHPWAKTQTAPQLEAWGKDAPVYMPDARVPVGKAGEGTGAIDLDPDVASIAKAAGMTPAEFVEAQKKMQRPS